MSTYILMKILESAPERYDRGIKILTRGKLDQSYDRLVSHIKKKHHVLDIGCGTGALTLRAAMKGARIRGIDVNAGMLEIAQNRIDNANLSDRVELVEMGVGELGNEKTSSYDIVMSGLCFSELSEDELNYALKETKRILNPGGSLLIADETIAQSPFRRLFNWLFRVPLVIITYIFTQTTTRGVRDLPDKLKKAGFFIESIRLNFMENFVEITGRIPGE